MVFSLQPNKGTEQLPGHLPLLQGLKDCQTQRCGLFLPICSEGQLKDPASVTYLYRISHHTFLNAFNTHELSFYSVPDTVLGTEYPGIEKTVEISALLNLIVSWRYRN